MGYDCEKKNKYYSETAKGDRFELYDQKNIFY